LYHETSPAAGKKINAYMISYLQLQVYISRKRKASVMIANQHTLDIQQSHHGSQKAVLRNPFHCIEWTESPANCKTVNQNSDKCMPQFAQGWAGHEMFVMNVTC